MWWILTNSTKNVIQHSNILYNSERHSVLWQKSCQSQHETWKKCVCVRMYVIADQIGDCICAQIIDYAKNIYVIPSISFSPLNPAANLMPVRKLYLKFVQKRWNTNWILSCHKSIKSILCVVLINYSLQLPSAQEKNTLIKRNFFEF